MSGLVNFLKGFASNFNSFFNSVITVLNYIYSILYTLWYGLTSLLSGTWDLIYDLFTGSLFDYVVSGFNQLSTIIGLPATIFVSSLFFVSLISIVIGFVFKIFVLRLGFDMSSKWKE